MTTEQFDCADFDILLEALECWGDHAPNPMSDILATMIASSNEDQARSRMDQLKAEHDDNRRQRKEQAITLQAKLIRIRHQQEEQEDHA